MWKINKSQNLVKALSLGAVFTATFGASQGFAQNTQNGWFDPNATTAAVAPAPEADAKADLVFTTDPVTQVVTDQYGRTYSKKEVLCHNFSKVDVTIDGVKTQRYPITKPELLQCIPPQPKAPWKVLKTEWSQADETNWRSFVQAMGKSKCNTVDTCLAGSANPYRDQVDMNAVFYADCADFPMYLRAYFSYKNNLPFSFGYDLLGNEPNAGQMEGLEKRRQQAIAKGQEIEFLNSLKDIRYSVNGNHYGTRVNVPNASGAARDFFTVGSLIHNQISSGSFRMLFTPPGKPLADFYSPAINKDSIVPGTVLYKPTGHVAMIYEITPGGDIKYIDAHPDGSVSRGAYSKEYMQSVPSHSAGFKNWRPIKLSNVTKNAEGVITKARVEMTPDQDIADFSLEQYFGNTDAYNSEWTKAKWKAQGRELSFVDYVKVRMANGVYKLNPLFQFRQDVNALCVDLQGRATSVDVAVQAGIHMMPHPAKLPRNIYGADGDWESYSTPGRDLRIRKRVKDLMESVEDYMKKWKSADPFFDYQGTNLKADMIKVYYQQDATCKIAYKNSTGKNITMGLSTALGRLAKISFDPYFCAERRWGASSPAELASCSETPDKATWYEYQQFLRNSTERDPTEVMGWSLNELSGLVKKGAVDNKDKSSEYNIMKRLQAL